MTFWLNVGLCYLALLAVGLGIGVFLGSRRRGGGGTDTEPVSPEPTGPTLALDCPPLGSDFDRAWLPGAFDDKRYGTVVGSVADASGNNRPASRRASAMYSARVSG